MAVSAGTAVLQVAPQLVKSFSRDVVSQMAGPATRAANKTGKDSGRKFGVGFSGGIRTGVGPVKGILRGFGPGLAAAFGGAALVSSIKSVTDEAREAAVVGRQTAAVLKSTGGAANISAKGVEQLATALSNKVGVDDEAIQSSQNLLLTFTGVRNETGKGNQIFNQASSTILDMTAAMNKGNITSQGLKASTIQVGKALNDPIKGMTALSKVGVTFTQGQKDQIKTLVESGDKLGAQKIILAELRKEFGGSAVASADAGKRFGVFIGNLKEQIGAALLPILNKFLSFLVDKLPGALRAVGGFFRLVSTGVQALVAAFKEGDVTSDGFVGVMEKIGVAIRTVWGALVRLLVPAFRSIADSLKPAIAAFASGLLPGLKSLWKVLVAQVFPALKIVAAVIGGALFVALKFLLPLLLRIAGPVLGFFFKQLGQTIQWISNVIRWIGRIGAWLLRWITGTKTTGAAVQKLAETAATQFRAMGNAAKAMWERVLKPAFLFIARAWLTTVGIIVRGAATALGWVPGVGPKLRAAARKFGEFAAGVNRSLNSIDDENVNVTATAKVQTTNATRQALNALGIKGYGTKFLAVGGAVSGPGTGTSDSIPAMLSAGEHVWTAKEVRAAGGHGAVEQLREQVARGYAAGGPVLDVPVRASGIGGAGDRFQRAAVLAVRKLGDRAADALAGLVGKALGKKMEGAGGGKAAIKAFIKSVDPLPYIWGAVGPGGYDCSGLVGEVMNRHLGKPSYRRLFTTASIRAGQYGLKSGLGGVLQIGVTAGSGHMAGRYGGLGFEAESSRTGIKVGTAASRPESFARRYHLAKGGPVEQRIAATFADLGLDVGGDPGKLRVNGQTFDQGGLLPTGTTLATNNTGRPELVMPLGALSTAFRKPLQSWVVPWLKRIAVGVERIHVGGSGGGRGGGGGGKGKKPAPWWAKYGASVDWGDVRESTWNALYAAGWRGRPGDHAERLYRPRTFDRGGTLSPGLNLVANRTGRPEPLVPAGGQSRVEVTVNVNGAIISDARAARDLADRLEPHIRNAVLRTERRR